MTNQQRCETTIELSGRTWTLRGTHGAIAEIEAATGLGIAGVTRRFAAYEFGLGEVAAVIGAGIRAVHAEAPQGEAIRHAEVDHGLGRCAAVAAAFLAMILSDGAEADAAVSDGPADASGPCLRGGRGPRPITPATTYPGETPCPATPISPWR
jgi:hypothetical protein